MSEEPAIKPRPEIPTDREFNAFAMIVDINQFTEMVSRAEKDRDLIAQFTRDALYGAIKAIEAEGGEVVAFMGDAILGVIPDGDSAVRACFGIAKDIDDQCGYLSSGQIGPEEEWSYGFVPGGPSVKIAIEYGTLDVSTIHSRLLGEQRLLIGSAINYAARISAAGEGNRCIVGPVAAKKEFSAYRLEGPHSISGKHGEPTYEYYFFPLGSVWVEGPRKPGEKSYW